MSVKATWVVDPALLDHAAHLDTPVAESWLADSAARGVRSVPLPHCPTAIPTWQLSRRPGAPGSWCRANPRATGYFAESSTQNRGQTWPGPPMEPVTSRPSLLRRAQATRSCLLDGENAPLVTPETYTPSGRISWPDPEVDVLLADEAASALVATPATTQGDVLLARQRFLAETYLHSLETPTRTPPGDRTTSPLGPLA